MTLRIEVPMLPPTENSPNWRGHWAQRYNASKAYAYAVFLYAGQACMEQGYPKPAFERARMDLTFVFPTKRRRDEDNMRARFKPGQDALVMAEVVRDDKPEHLEMGGITFVADKKQAPLTIIELTDLAEAGHKRT